MTDGAYDARHQALREAIGPLVLGHLDTDETATLQAHLDGCASCRDDLALIAPLVARLDSVDARRLDHPPAPPPGLGRQIHARVAQERAAHQPAAGLDEARHRETRGSRRTPGRALLLGAAAALVTAALVGGLLVGRATAPDPAAAPLEAISLESADRAELTVESAGLVAHSWGVELRLVGAGFDEGDTFRAAFRDASSGELTAAGEFLGTGAASMTCSLQSAVLREDVSEVVVTDESGAMVLRADV